MYVSATGGSGVYKLASATLLGRWGPTTAFADRRAFVDSLRRGGIAAMELIARDLKMQGLYVARALSFAGVEYDILEHRLTPDQVERSEEHTSELQSLMRISYAVFCLKKKNKIQTQTK